jgi:hypothetical protein
MPNRIILKRSSVAAKVPLASDLSAGELAINLTDKRLFSEDASGNIINITVDATHVTSGTLAAARLPAFSGDATSTAGTSSLTLANSGVTAGTYTKVTVDAKGRVTVGASLVSADLPTYTGTITSSQVTTALGFTPYSSANPNGYTSNVGTVTSVSGTGSVSGLTLTGSVTTSGSLTLGGTLSAGIANISDLHRLFNNSGDNHSARTSFDATSPSYNFGWRYVQGSTNGPGVNSASQYYSLYVGLGNDYPATGAGSYGMIIAVPRNVSTPYLAIRYNESNTLGSWQKISAGYADTAGSAGTVTNGVYTTGTYADPAWITSLAKSKVGLGNVENTALSTWAGSANITTLGTIASGTVPVARVSGLATSATTDTTNAANISSGTLPSARLTGTYAISVSGNAATATTTDNINGRAFLNRDSGNVLGQDSYTTNGVGYVNGTSLFSQSDGGLYASAYSTSWVHQIYGDFRTGQIAIRGKNSGTWQAWRTVLDSSNYTSYSPSLTGSGASGTWGISITGNAATVTNGVYTTGNQTVGGIKTFSSSTYFSGGYVEITAAFVGDGLYLKNGATLIGAIFRANSRVNFGAGSGSANGFTFNTSTTSNAVLINADGALTSTGAIADLYGNVRDVPQNAQTAAYTLVAADRGRHISITTGGVTVPSGIFSAGNAITIYNNSGSSQTITQGASVTMYLGGTATTGNRTIAQRGVATLLCVASNVFVISGAGLT